MRIIVYTISIRRKQRILNNYFTNSCISIKKRVTPPTSVTSFQFQSRAFPQIWPKEWTPCFPRTRMFQTRGQFRHFKRKEGCQSLTHSQRGRENDWWRFCPFRFLPSAPSGLYRLPLPICIVCPFYFISAAPSMSSYPGEILHFRGSFQWQNYEFIIRNPPRRGWGPNLHEQILFCICEHYQMNDRSSASSLCFEYYADHNRNT